MTNESFSEAMLNFQRIKEIRNRKKVTNRIRAIVNFSEKLGEKAERLESVILDDVGDYFEEIIVQIEDSDIDFNTRDFARSIIKSEERLRGQLKLYLSNYLSLDHQDFSSIWYLNAGERQRQAMEEFEKKVLTDGVRELVKQVEEVVQLHIEELDMMLQQLLIEKQDSVFRQAELINDELNQLDEEMKNREAVKVSSIAHLYAVQTVAALTNSIK